MKLKQVAHWLSSSCASEQVINYFTIDSRKVQPGDVFVALPGETHQGHIFISSAAERGAIAVITDKADPNTDIPQFIVKDCLHALTTIATAHRQQAKCPTIALTGSNGKTTVKEMIYSALPKPSLATSGNFNNHIGVPLSVLCLRPEHRYAVFELGANHKGEIEHTVKIALPDIALINNIAPAHIEGFGSIEGIAQAKGEIYQGLGDNGIAVINDDDAFHHYWDSSVKDKSVIRFSMNHPADVYADDIKMDQFNCAQFTIYFPNKQTANIHLQVPGQHSIANALAAASCLTGLQVPVEEIANGLNQFKGVAGRFNHLKGQKESHIIDDSYNANLGSTQRAIETLAKYPGIRILIMGDMGELGQWGEEHHKLVGKMAKQHHIDQVLTLGKLSSATSAAFGDNSHHFDNLDSLLAYAKTLLSSNVVVLIKGSRSAKMERIVDALKAKESLANEAN